MTHDIFILKHFILTLIRITIPTILHKVLFITLGLNNLYHR